MRLAPIALLLALAAPAPAAANCTEPWLDPAPLAPYIARWAAGPAARKALVARFERGAYVMAPAFDELGAAAKQAAIDAALGGWPSVLTPAEATKLAAMQQRTDSDYPTPWLAPDVRAADGRLVHTARGGCYAETLLTERQRFVDRSYQTSAAGPARAWLYNAGQPPWRVVRHPIAPAADARQRAAFWRAIKPANASDHWIAWVPERGWYEIDMPRAAWAPGWLARVAGRLPGRYRYVVLDEAGDRLEGPR